MQCYSNSSKIILRLLVILLFSIPILAYSGDKFLIKNIESEKGMNFTEGTWKEVLAIAKKENKPVFLDIYTTWCGPCKKLKANTFSNKNVGAFYNKHFINVSVDAEKGEGRTLAKQFNITGFPTLIFVDAEGKLINKTMGYHNAKDFLKLGEFVLEKH